MGLIYRSQEEIDALIKLIKAGATFTGPDGDPLVEEAALQRLLLLNPHMTFGVIRQAPDSHDIPAKAAPPPTLPKYDLRKWASPIEAQGSIGSCFANAAVGLLELQDTGKGKFKDKSRLFNFYNTHSIAGTLGNDCGATIKDCMKALQKFGICDESMWPYDVNKCWVKPTPDCYNQAINYKISAYKYLQAGNVEAAKGMLAQNYPIIFGFDVFKSFMSPQIGLSGVLEMPGVSERSDGGHAVALVGYDDLKQWFIVRNSWGKNWGANGYFFMPYNFYRKHSWDPWVVIV